MYTIKLKSIILSPNIKFIFFCIDIIHLEISVFCTYDVKIGQTFTYDVKKDLYIFCINFQCTSLINRSFQVLRKAEKVSI